MGGGSLRAATKVAGGGIGVPCHRRGFLAVPPAPEHSAMRNASRPVSETISARGGDKQMTLARRVFGPPPSIEEAKSATNDLKATLEKYSFNTQVIPKAAIQAIEFVCNSSAAQSVVASIASDPNVLHAMLNNPDFKDFIQANEPCYKLEDEQTNSLNIAEEHSDEPAGKSKNTSSMFWMFLNKIKKYVRGKVMNNLSGLIESIFGTKSAETETDQSSWLQLKVFSGLAFIVILLVLGKRG